MSSVIDEGIVYVGYKDPSIMIHAQHVIVQCYSARVSVLFSSICNKCFDPIRDTFSYQLYSS